MRKNIFKRFSAAALAGAVVATALPTTSFEVLAEAEYAVPTGAVEIEGYYYGTVNVPYADFYYGELNAVSADSATAVSESSRDIVGEATISVDNVEGGTVNYREYEAYDAVTSATTSKYKMYTASYYTDSTTEPATEGNQIHGMKAVPVRINAALFTSIAGDDEQIGTSDDTATNGAFALLKDVTWSSEASAYYKQFNGDGTLSVLTGASEVTDTDATVSISENTTYGDYQLSVANLGTDDISVDGKSNLWGAVIVTKTGEKVGLKHGTNLWFSAGEIAFDVNNATTVHGNTLEYGYTDCLEGKTISSIIYYLNDGSKLTVNTESKIKTKLEDADGGAYAKASISASDVDYVAGLDLTSAIEESGTFPAGYDFTLASLYYTSGKTSVVVDASNYSLDGNTLTLKGNSGFDWTTASSYTLVFEDDVYSGVKATLKLNIPTTTLSLDKTSTTLSVGDTTTLTPSNTPSTSTDELSWSSSNPSVATIETVATTSGRSTVYSYVVTAVAPGTATITATKGSATATCQVTVSPYNLAAGTLKLSNTSYTYTGAAFTPATTVTYNGKTLVKDTDYTVTYKNNTNAGTATVAVTGKGNYTGTLTSTFKINAISIKSAKVTLKTTSYSYDGKAKKPAIKSVVLNGKTLSSSNYTVTYKNNKNAGTATVTITGKGNYTGSAKATFTIKASLSSTFKNTSKTLKASTLKTKAQTFAIAKKFSGGKVTYTVTKGTKKYISVNSTTGKVTVKKGAKKGTYKVKVTVAAKGNYKKTTKTITIKVK